MFIREIYIEHMEQNVTLKSYLIYVVTPAAFAVNDILSILEKTRLPFIKLIRVKDINCYNVFDGKSGEFLEQKTITG